MGNIEQNYNSGSIQNQAHSQDTRCYLGNPRKPAKEGLY
jgi:hypothetical protein